MNKWLNKRTGLITAAAVICIIIAVVVSTSFSSAMNLDQAKDIAQKHVPSSAKFVSSEEEDRYFEVVFYDDENKEGFEVEVNKETGEVKKVESQLSNDAGSAEVKLTEDEAKKVVKDRFDGIQSITVVLTKDNGLYEYEASFKSDGFYGDADVNAETGAILDSVVKYGTVLTIPTDESSNGSESGLISYEQARDLTLEEAGGGIIRDIDLDRENQDYFYEVELHIDGMERDYIVNAKTSEVMLASEHQCYFEEYHDDSDGESIEYVENYNENVDNFSQNDSSSSTETDVSADGNVGDGNQNGLLTEAEAKDIVWAKIPGAEIVEFYMERDDGIQQYEGTAYLDGYEYEFEINAASGVIINWERDVIEYDDDDEWDD